MSYLTMKMYKSSCTCIKSILLWLGTKRWLNTVHKYKSAIIKWIKTNSEWTTSIHMYWCNDTTWHCKSHLSIRTGWMNIVCHICTGLRHLYYSDNIVLLHYKTCTLYLSPTVTQHSFTITLLVSDNDVNILCKKKYRLTIIADLQQPNTVLQYIYIHYLSVYAVQRHAKRGSSVPLLKF